MFVDRYVFKPLPENKILAFTKLEAFADDNFSVAQMVKFFFARRENIVRKGENAGYHHFLLFLQCFQKSGFSKVRNFTVKDLKKKENDSVFQKET